ncbi:MAG: transporter [Lautropia sp. SCN 66-9]|nr:MAG: transporter [Lautropia sp. SCN 66-9]
MTHAVSRPTALLLNIAHALDHLFLLVFATAVGAIAADFGVQRWEDLMPYGVGAFFLFGIGALPAGRLGDLWGRRSMMLIFFFGIAAAALLAACATGPWQLAIALTLLGAFAAIYHPVGIPMIVQGAARPGWTIGVNGLAGNLGVAAAAVLTGVLVQAAGWRTAFVVPAIISIVAGLLFMRYAPRETEPPSKRPTKAAVQLSPAMLARAFVAMTAAAASGSLLFNFSTNGNGQLLAERMQAVVNDPALLGTLLALIYVIASFAQLVVGKLIDRFSLKRLYLVIVLTQIPVLLAAMHAHGWLLYALLLLEMTLLFGAIPFTDAMIVRYVDDRLRSRVGGMRLTVAFGLSSVAVWALGPLVKSGGFAFLLGLMAVIAGCTALAVGWLPAERSGEALQSAPAR